MLGFYRAVTHAVEPLVAGVVRRLPHGRERTGEDEVQRPDGQLIWMHGDSVGESLLLLVLIDAIHRKRPDISFLVTSLTSTSAEILVSRQRPRTQRRFAPLDFPGCVRRFLKKWRPDMLVLAESGFWPVVITEADSAGVPIVLVNARMSKRSMRNWRRMGGMLRELLGRISLLMAQDRRVAENFVALGAKPALVSAPGSLKASAAVLPADGREVKKFRHIIGRRQIWMAASTHEADEPVVMDAQQILREGACPEALLLIVPRHPERGNDLRQRLEARGWRVGQRSRGEEPEADVQVYLADTIGELGIWYRLAPVTLLGGSFGGAGGHNPFEAAFLDSAILHGPDTENFRDIYARLDTIGGAVQVEDAASLASSVAGLLGLSGEAKQRRIRIAGQARQLADEAPDIPERIAGRILHLLAG